MHSFVKQHRSSHYEEMLEIPMHTFLRKLHRRTALQLKHCLSLPCRLNFRLNFIVRLFLFVIAVKFLEDEFKAEVVSINIPELEVCVHSLYFFKKLMQEEGPHA